jgi:hypothetical protein
MTDELIERLTQLMNEIVKLENFLVDEGIHDSEVQHVPNLGELRFNIRGDTRILSLIRDDRVIMVHVRLGKMGEVAVEIPQASEIPEGYVLLYSGGSDGPNLD